MKQFRYIFACVSITLFSISFQASSQLLTKEKLSKEEINNGIFEKFLYTPKEVHGYTSLVLFKNGEYTYTKRNFGLTYTNKGFWELSNGILNLKEEFKQNNLPVTLQYFQTPDSGFSFKLRVTKNLNGELLTDGFIFINNDSIRCLPLTQTCIGDYSKIDSVKIVFENGCKSKWIKIERTDYQQLQLILNSNVVMKSYIPLKNHTYKRTRFYIKPTE